MAVIADLQAKVQSLSDTVISMEESVQMMSEKFDTALAELSQHENSLADMKKRIEKFEGNQSSGQIEDIKKEINELEKHNRKLNLEIHGIKKTDNEDLLAKVNKCVESLELPQLTTCDVTAIHRLPSKPDKTPGIIVRFARQAVRDDWFNNRKKLKEAHKNENVYIQENLTKQTRTLLWEAKQWALDKNYRFVWQSGGKVLIRKKEGDTAVVVKSKNHLMTLA